MGKGDLEKRKDIRAPEAETPRGTPTKRSGLWRQSLEHEGSGERGEAHKSRARSNEEVRRWMARAGNSRTGNESACNLLEGGVRMLGRLVVMLTWRHPKGGNGKRDASTKVCQANLQYVC